MNVDKLISYMNDCDKMYVNIGLNSKCTDDEVLKMLSLHTKQLSRIVRDVLKTMVKEDSEQ